MKNIKIKLITLSILGIIYTSCSTDDDKNSDTTAPTVLIQSPNLNQNYVGYWGGAWPETDKVSLKALGTDETRIASMKLTVLNSNGTIVFEKTVNSKTNTQTELIISENFTPKEIGTYNVILSANDVSGNITTSDALPFSVL